MLRPLAGCSESQTSILFAERAAFEGQCFLRVAPLVLMCLPQSSQGSASFHPDGLTSRRAPGAGGLLTRTFNYTRRLQAARFIRSSGFSWQISDHPRNQRQNGLYLF